MPQIANDQVWLITGAGSGFGYALAKTVLERGGKVAAAIRSLERPAIAELRALGQQRLHLCRFDVTQADQVRRGVDDAVTHFGKLDVVVNNAGRGSFGSLEETSDAEIRDLFEVNFFGSLNVIRSVLPVLRRQRSGHLVQMSSLAGVAPPAPGLAAYSATKFAVEGLNEALAQEVAHLDIGVTIVEPGDFRTGFGHALHATPPEMPEYEDSVGFAAQAFASMDHATLGDPDRAATAIVDAITSDTPPLRMILGDDANDAVRKKLTAQLAEIQLWENAGRATR